MDDEEGDDVPAVANGAAVTDAAAVPAVKRARQMRPRPKLTVDMLIGRSGLVALVEKMKKEKLPLYKTVGAMEREVPVHKNLEKVLSTIEAWAGRLGSGIPFAQFVERADKMAGNRAVVQQMRALREGASAEECLEAGQIGNMKRGAIFETQRAEEAEETRLAEEEEEERRERAERELAGGTTYDEYNEAEAAARMEEDYQRTQQRQTPTMGNTQSETVPSQQKPVRAWSPSMDDMNPDDEFGFEGPPESPPPPEEDEDAFPPNTTQSPSIRTQMSGFPAAQRAPTQPSTQGYTQDIPSTIPLGTQQSSSAGFVGGAGTQSIAVTYQPKSTQGTSAAAVGGESMSLPVHYHPKGSKTSPSHARDGELDEESERRDEDASNDSGPVRQQAKKTKRTMRIDDDDE